MILEILCLVALATTDAASFGNGAAAGASAGAASTSYGGTNGQAQGVKLGSTSGYTGTGTYSPSFPYNSISGQQLSSLYPNSNYPNNFNYLNFQYPNQFQNPYQAQFQNQFQQQQQFPFVPFPPIPFPQFLPAAFTPPEYQQAFAQFQNSLQQQIASGASFAHSTPGASAYAISSLGPSNLYNQQQTANWNQYENGDGGANSVPYYAPNFASATGSYGPNGIHQTASIYPENPKSPNVDSRFGVSGPNDGGVNGPNGGFFGVSTSSFSSSSDINGVKMNRRGAITSVNDNGKITTHKVVS